MATPIPMLVQGLDRVGGAIGEPHPARDAGATVAADLDHLPRRIRRAGEVEQECEPGADRAPASDDAECGEREPHAVLPVDQLECVLDREVVGAEE